MIAGKASETASVVFPCGALALSAFNVGCWAYLSTDATAHTAVCFHPESFVVNQLSFEKFANKPAVYAWPSPHMGLFFHALALVNLLHNAGEVNLGVVFLLSFFVDSVYIHKG